MLTEQGFVKIYTQFFPNGDPTKFASLVFRVFDENHVSSVHEAGFLNAKVAPYSVTQFIVKTIVNLVTL